MPPALARRSIVDYQLKLWPELDHGTVSDTPKARWYAAECMKAACGDSQHHNHACFVSRWQHRLSQYIKNSASQDRAHDISHVKRVWANCQSIAASEPDASVGVLLPACYLHDIDSFSKNDPNRPLSSTRSAHNAVQVLKELTYPDNFLPDIFHAIQAHSYSANIRPRTLEAKILQDADRLDALGAIGLARTFHVAGQLNTPIYDPDDPFATGRPLNDVEFSLDHFQMKLFHLCQTMHTREGGRLAKARTRTLKRFMKTLSTEIRPIDSWE